MAEPVKTFLLKDLEARLQAIPGLPTVRRQFDLPLDLDETDPETGAEMIAKPAMFFWEGPEDSEEENLITRNALQLSLVTYFKLSGALGDGQTPTFQVFADEAEVLAIPIKKMLANAANLAAWGDLGLLEMEPIGISKALASETYGEMVLTYRLTYWHRLGDAASLNLL